MGILLSISRKSGSGNARVSQAETEPDPEASAMLVTEASFAPDLAAKPRRKSRLPAVPKEAL
jgi:hypothetical protein